MEFSSLAGLEKIAGLTGIALGVVVLLVRPAIRNPATLPAKQRKPLLRLMLIGAFGIGALGIWSGNSGSRVVTAGPCGVAASDTASGNHINCGAVPGNTAPTKP